MDYPDNELINMVAENNEDARDMLYEKYNYIVSFILRKYMAKCRSLKLDYNELKQEALVGFSDAIANYNQDKDAKLNTFITVCVERRLNNYIRNMETVKERIRKDALSLDYEIDEEHSLYEIIGNDTLDPQNLLENSENFKNLLDKIENNLSDAEKDVLNLMLQNYSNEEIADKLNINIKSVYNTIARIRSKLK